MAQIFDDHHRYSFDKHLVDNWNDRFFSEFGD